MVFRSRRLLVPGLACLALTAAGLAFAASPVVTITSSGPSPDALSIGWGGTVRFTNADSVPHTLKVSGAGGRVQTIAAGASADAVFAGRSGSVRYTIGGGRFHLHGTVQVQGLSGRLTLESSTNSILFGGQLVLRGHTTLGLPVTVQEESLQEARALNQGIWSDLKTARPRPDGSFLMRVTPAAGARYRATTAGGQLRSAAVRVHVTPSISSTLAPRTLAIGRTVLARARVFPADAATHAVLSRFVPAQKRWVVVGRGVVRGGRVVIPWRADRAGKLELRVSLAGGGVDSGFESADGVPVPVVVSWPPTTLALEAVAGSAGAPRWDTGLLTAHPGRITLAMQNLDASAHNVAIRGGGVSVKGAVVAKGGTSQVTADLPAGKYTFYSSADNPKSGLSGTLIVR